MVCPAAHTVQKISLPHLCISFICDAWVIIFGLLKTCSGGWNIAPLKWAVSLYVKNCLNPTYSEQILSAFIYKNELSEIFSYIDNCSQPLNYNFIMFLNKQAESRALLLIQLDRSSWQQIFLQLFPEVLRTRHSTLLRVSLIPVCWNITIAALHILLLINSGPQQLLHL